MKRTKRREAEPLTCTLGLWAVCLTMLIALTAGARADEATVTGSEAFRVLAKEQSFAESYVVLLKTMSKEDFRRYADGIRYYASARAEFDGLIEQMKQDIIQHDPFGRSEIFQAVLRTAVERRMKFTRHVDETVEALGVGEGSRAGVKDYVASAAELLAIIGKAAKAVWDEYWTIKETRRKETLTQLEALKWKAFHKIPGEN